MNNKHIASTGTLLSLAAALALPGASALAAETVQEMTSPNVAEVGVTVADYGSEVPPFQREYSGITGNTKGSLDLNFVNRSDTGWWIKAYTRQFNLPTQEYGALVEWQGHFRVAYDHYEAVKYSRYDLNTKVQGIGTSELVLNPDFRSSAGLGPLRSLELKRVKNGVGAYVTLLPNLRFNIGARVEDKTGEIMSSTIGSTLNNPYGNGKNYSTMYFAPQPEDYRHRQVDASFDYGGKKLQLSAGFYGSYFTNNNLALNITPGYNSIPTVGPGAAIQPLACRNGNPCNYADPWISLSPDNQAHTLFLNGGYSFTNATRLTFRAARTVATQNDGFVPSYGGLTAATGYNDLNPPGVPYSSAVTANSLNGRMVTTSYAATFTSRLTDKLNVKAAVRYQDRDDQTPQRLYLLLANLTEFPDGETNDLHNEKDTKATLEASYQLPAAIRATAGYVHEKLERPDSPRPETSENTFRLEFTRPLGDTFSGWVIYTYARRTGGEWDLPDPTPSTGAAVTFSTATAVAAPLQFVDRNRGKLRVMVDWSPTEKFSGQAYLEHQRDVYPYTPATGNARMGMTHASTETAGADLDFQLTRKWHATGYLTYDIGKSHQNELYTPRPASGDQDCSIRTAAANGFRSNCSPWEAELSTRGRVYGVGLVGKALKKLDLRLDYLYSKDNSGYGITFDPLYPDASVGGGGSSVPAGAGLLPATIYSVSRLHLAGSLPVGKSTRVRVDYIYDERKYSDYAWTGWSYSDGTVVNVAPVQLEQMVAVSLYIRL
jgi:MtrB/PioB family decaheme-associated outer membrane protein